MGQNGRYQVVLASKSASHLPVQIHINIFYYFTILLTYRHYSNVFRPEYQAYAHGRAKSHRNVDLSAVNGL
jgi:hypothetical protein